MFTIEYPLSAMYRDSMKPEKHSPLYLRRRQLGIKQSQIAAGLGVSISTLSAIENGHRLPDGLAVVDFGREYKCSLQEMIELLENTRAWRNEQGVEGPG